MISMPTRAEIVRGLIGCIAWAIILGILTATAGHIVCTKIYPAPAAGVDANY